MRTHYFQYQFLGDGPITVICNSEDQMIEYLWDQLNSLYQRRVGFEWFKTMYEGRWHDPTVKKEFQRSKKKNVETALEYGILTLKWTAIYNPELSRPIAFSFEKDGHTKLY